MAKNLKLGGKPNGSTAWRTIKGSTLFYTDEDGIYEGVPSEVICSTSKTTVNKDGLIVTVEADTSAIDYSDDVDGALRNEDDGENFLFNSGWLGAEKPTDWNTGFAGGVISIESSINGGLISARRFQASSNRQTLYRDFDFVSGTTYFCSVLLEAVITPVSIQEIIFFNSTGTRTYFEDGVEVTGTTLLSMGKEYGAKFVATATATNQMRIGCGTAGNATGDVTISAPQLEIGEKRTSTIISPTGATGVRGKDQLTGIGREDLFNSVEGVLSFESSIFTDAGSNKEIMLYGDVDNFITAYYQSGFNRVTIRHKSSGVSAYLYTGTFDVTQRTSIAMYYNSNVLRIYKDGVLVDEDLSITPLANGAIQELRMKSHTGTNIFFGKIQELTVYKNIQSAVNDGLTYLQ